MYAGTITQDLEHGFLFILTLLQTLGYTRDGDLRNSPAHLAIANSASADQCSVLSKFMNHYSLPIFIFLKQSVTLQKI